MVAVTAKASFGGVCLESCACTGCQLGTKKAVAVWEAEVATKHGTNMILVDTAVRLQEGEVLVVAVLTHEIDEDALGVQFQIEWSDGDTTWQRLESLVDLDDDDAPIVNDKVLTYTTVMVLDMKRYLQTLVNEREEDDADGVATLRKKRTRQPNF